MAYWAVARLEPQRESGFTVYFPRLREQRIRHGRKITVTPPLFPGYLFLQIVNGWWKARWSFGIASLIMDGSGPARVADGIIDEIRSRERGGLVELLSPRLRTGDAVRVTRGPLCGLDGLYAGQAPHERVAILLTLLGGERRVILAKDDVEPV
jgi:transcriptional antiterminator RfaH